MLVLLNYAVRKPDHNAELVGFFHENPHQRAQLFGYVGTKMPKI
jgi:hypothetical protein